ncbi:MAG: mannose-1-phosphate guanylyltransferase [bacterium]|nr:mannose-1-phosphate guanylyltransferase [bacterium]
MLGLKKMIWGIILAGGRGERFWPASRKKRPKQLLRITGDKTMLEETIERIEPLIPKTRILIVTSLDIAPSIRAIFPHAKILAEPTGRNTLPAISLASLWVEKENKDGILVVLPSDHFIKDKDRFLKTLKAGVKYAEKLDCLITMGITPTRPETGYGYIEAGHEAGKEDDISVNRVNAFREKPEQETARSFIRKGNYFWNSGMFIFKVSTLIRAIQEHRPKLYENLMELKVHLGKRTWKGALNRFYTQIESESFDYGIMEHAKNILVIKADFGWDDVGDFSALERIYDKDRDGNIHRGECALFETKDVIVLSENLVVTLGVKDLVVVNTKDVTFICNKKRTQDVKKVVEFLKRDYERYL